MHALYIHIHYIYAIYMLLNYYYTSILLIILYYGNINKEEEFLQTLLKTHLTTNIQTI